MINGEFNVHTVGSYEVLFSQNIIMVKCFSLAMKVKVPFAFLAIWFTRLITFGDFGEILMDINI